jgi:hypothetical protein
MQGTEILSRYFFLYNAKQQHNGHMIYSALRFMAVTDEALKLGNVKF